MNLSRRELLQGAIAGATSFSLFGLLTSASAKIAPKAVLKPRIAPLHSKVLMVDEVPIDHLARYECDVYVPTYCFNQHGQIEGRLAAEEVLVPYISKGTVTDKHFLTMLEHGARDHGHIMVVVGETGASDINYGMTLIEEHELIAARVIMHPDNPFMNSEYANEFFDFDGDGAHIYSADIIKSEACDINSMYILAPNQFVGVNPQPVDKPDMEGIAIINGYAISVIKGV
jgi:hypothetical protein